MTDQAEVIEVGGQVQRIEIGGQVQLLEVGIQGPPGAMGPPGNSYTHTQVSPSDQWIINHNFGYEPIVVVLSTGGAQMLAEVVNVSLNQTRVYFAVPLAGRARLM